MKQIFIIFVMSAFISSIIEPSIAQTACPDCSSPINNGKSCGFGKCGICDVDTSLTPPNYSCNPAEGNDCAAEGSCTTSDGREGTCEAQGNGECKCEVGEQQEELQGQER